MFSGAFLPSFGARFFVFFSLILCPALQGSLFFYYWHLKVLGIFWIQFLCQNMICGTSLAVQWTGFFLPARGTQVRSLAQEDLMRCGASKAVRHNFRACGLQVLKPVGLEPDSATGEAAAGRRLGTSARSSPHSPRPEKAARQQRPSAGKHRRKGARLTRSFCWSVVCILTLLMLPFKVQTFKISVESDLSIYLSFLKLFCV